MLDMNEIEKIIKDFEPRHTAFQMDNFIVGKAGHPYFQYRQAQREIADRQQTVLDLRDNLKLAEMQKMRWPFGKRAKIKAAMRARRIEQMRKDLAEYERELARLVEIGRALHENYGELCREEKDQLESEAWRQKAIRMAGIDLLVNGRVNSTTLEFILSLPKADRLRVIENFKPGTKVDPYKMIGL